MNEIATPITAEAAFRKLSQAGYPRTYVKRFLPDWWDNSLIRTSAGSLQFALILRQQLGLQVAFNTDGTIEIEAAAPKAKFKHRTDTQESELTIAANLGLALVKTSLHAVQVSYKHLPSDPLELRDLCLQRSHKNAIDFASLLDLCWSFGIPVLFLNFLPKSSKRVTGMSVLVDGRPAIILGFNHKQSARQLFVLAHELGHILLNHIEDNGVLLDEEISEIQGNLQGSPEVPRDQQESDADQFALSLIRGLNRELIEEIGSPKSAAALAANSISVANKYGIDPGHLILSFGKANDDWARANQALNFLPRDDNPLQLMESLFKKYTDLNILSEEHHNYVLLTQGFKK